MKIAAMPWKKPSTDAIVIPLEGASPDDIVIPVVGPTGVGKSTFINFLAGEEVVKVGHELYSCTSKLQPVIIRSPSQHPLLDGKRLVVVDTPPFNPTHGDDPDVFGSIASWLKSAYSNNMKLYGIIYLHDISLSLMRGERHHRFEAFQKICDDGGLRSVIGTTKWSDVYEEDGEMRTTQLCERYWKEIIEHGSKIYRFEDSSESAWSIVGSIIEANRDRTEVLQIQSKAVASDSTFTLTSTLTRGTQFSDETHMIYSQGGSRGAQF